MYNINKNPELLPTELVEQAKALSTSLISDAMSGFGVMNHKIKPVDASMKFAGTALTINLKTGSNLMFHTAIALASKGYVLVASTKGVTAAANIGDLMTRVAKKQEIEGIVIDGLVRDIADIREIGVPVFSLGVIPSAVERDGPGEINVSISCGGVSVNPGDFIMGDEDGVVVVPRDRISTVLSAAEKKAMSELKRIEDINNGIIMPEWLKQRLSDLGLDKRIDIK